MRGWRFTLKSRAVVERASVSTMVTDVAVSSAVDMVMG